MVEQIERFTREFFENLKSSLTFEGDILLIENVPKSFEDIFGKPSPYRLSFERDFEGDFEGRGRGFVR